MRLKQGRKCSPGMYWLQKDLWYGPANLDNRMSENVQNIQQRQKFHHKSHGKLESGIDNWKTNPWRGENLKRHLPGRLGDIVSRYHQTNRNKRKKEGKSTSEEISSKE